MWVDSPLLSILIPAFRYPEGVRRILFNLQPLLLQDCELIIFDDSPDNDVMDVVMEWRERTGSQIYYQRNQPALGAADNWNALLEAACGNFCLLMHHDEFPLREDFLKRLLQILREKPELDVLMLDCILVDFQSQQIRRHLPIWLRAFVVRHVSQYLFRRNVVGPVSSLVIRRSIYPRFNAQLRWLVDVELFVRLFSVAKHVHICPQLQIGSLLGRTDSITAKLGSSLHAIHQEELAYLSDLHRSSGVWLDSAWIHVLLRACESVSWLAMRVCARIAALFLQRPVSQSVVSRALIAINANIDESIDTPSIHHRG